jgi:lipoprotein NlpD
MSRNMTRKNVFIPLTSLAFLAACAVEETATPAPIQFEGTNPSVSQIPVERPLQPGEPDARGVISYPGYQVIRAREGDTVASISERVGADAATVASYNGLVPDYTPRAGDLIVLPPRDDRYGVNLAGSADDTGGWNIGLAAAAIARAGDSSSGPTPVAFPNEPAVEAARLSSDDPSVPRNGIQPVRHLVGPAETLFSIARLYDVSVTSITTWNGMNTNLVVAPGDVIYVPLPEDPTAEAALAAATPAPAVQPVAVTPSAESAPPPPPSATNELPQPVTATVPPLSPNMSAAAATGASDAIFMRPVDGEILRPFSAAPGASRNDGIDFAATAGTPVRAADDGEVIYVARSVGDFGNIVMIRHPNEIVTAYARLGAVTVAKGDTISRGATLGEVAANATPSMQFQVMRNMAPVDPAPFL